MATKIRFGAFVKEATSRHRKISLNDLILENRLDKDGNIARIAGLKINLRTIDVYRILQPYVSNRVMEQVKAVVLGLFVLVVFVCVGTGCSSESIKKTTYETLQNIRDQECSREPSVECEKRERFETYEQQRLSKENAE